MTRTERQLAKHIQPMDVTCIIAVVLTVVVYLVTREDSFKMLCVAQLTFLAGRQTKQ